MSSSREIVIGRRPLGKLGKDDQITWRARHFGVYWTMTVGITEYERPYWFVDEQVNGPFAAFRHVHRFTDSTGATEMADEITFTAPFGALGHVTEIVVLAPYLKRLIEQRNGYLKKRAESRF
jgi:ligand-binding SRPBCC domain-containing protein